MTVANLTPEQKKALLDELKAEEAAKDKALKENRKAYKEVVNDTIPVLFDHLLEASAVLSEAKTLVYNELKTLVAMKAELYGSEDNQSHTFTTSDGITIIIGCRFNDGWDDTVTAGLQKVRNYINNITGDKKIAMMVATINRLLARDHKGNLKSSRILQLKKIAEEYAEQELIDAINIIQDAYRPVRSVEFVTCRYKGNCGDPIDLPLDISSAPFDFIMPLDYAEKKKNKATPSPSETSTTDNLPG